MIDFDRLSPKEKRRLAKLEEKENKYIVSESGSYSKKTLKQLFRDYRMFVLLVLYVFLKTGNEPVVLVGAVTVFLSVEVWQLAKIKINEHNKEENEDE